MSTGPYCTECGEKMILLLISYMCANCADSKKNEFDDAQNTPTININWDFGDVDPTPTVKKLPRVQCKGCKSWGYSGSMCYACNLFRP